MRAAFLSMAFGIALSLAAGAAAQTASVTATCKDGSVFSGTSRSGACRGHQGVATWEAPAATASSTAAPPTATTRATPVATNSAGIAGAKPGRPGQVWVNTASKVYHCPGTRYYGKTKQGEYMSEMDAKSAGDHASGGKSCS
jgi:hypothetical protein